MSGSMSDAAHQLVTCPYNMAHQIERYKMQFHLKKCRAQYPDSPLKPCPFDITHVIREAELDYHVSTCPKREMFDTARYEMDDGPGYQSSVRAPPVEVTTSENWDTDNFETYDPKTQVSGNNIIRKVQGATPSERRLFRSEQARKYNK